MPAIIQPTMMPTFLATTIDEYLKPLLEYKNAYDAIEKSYNALEDLTAGLEQLKADYPESEAYKRYAEYQLNLSDAATSLSSIGLTPNSRKALHRMRDRYTKEMIPIIAGQAKIKEAKAKFDALKPGEVMSYDPYTMSIDNFIGSNPEFRPYDLEKITTQAKDAASAHSVREDLWYKDEAFSKQLANNFQTAIGHSTGFLNSDPKTISTIKNAQDVVNKLFNGETVNSEDPLIQDIVALVNAIDLTKMSNDTKSLVLSSIIHGTITGLRGNINYQFLTDKAGLSFGAGSGETPTLNYANTFELSNQGVDVDEELRDAIKNEHNAVKDLYDPGIFSSRVRKFNKLYEKDFPISKQENIYTSGSLSSSSLLNTTDPQIAITAYNKRKEAALKEQTLKDINDLRKKYNLPALEKVDDINDETREELDLAIDKLNKSGIYAKHIAVLNTQDATTTLSWFKNKIGLNSFDTNKKHKLMWVEDEDGNWTDDSKELANARKILYNSDTTVSFDFSKQRDANNFGEIVLTNNKYGNEKVKIVPEQLFDDYQTVNADTLKSFIYNQVKDLNYENMSDNDKLFIDIINSFISTESTSMLDMFRYLGKLQNITMDDNKLQAIKYNTFSSMLKIFGEGIRARGNMQLVSKPGTSSNELPTTKNHQSQL